MLKFLFLLYSVLFAFVINCYPLTHGNLLGVLICSILFILINILCGVCYKSSKKSLTLMRKSVILLVSFCFSVSFSVIFQGLILLRIIPIQKNLILGSIIYCVICNFILFWHGIICVYLFSTQLGIKYRILGVIFGFIPIINLIVLMLIIKTAYSEIQFESRKEKLNQLRQKDKVCATKYPILLARGG